MTGSWRLVASFIILLSSLNGCASTSRRPPRLTPFDGTMSASGMARLDARRFIVIHDTRAGEDGPRLGVLDLDRARSPRYTELPVNWSEHGGPSNDLESVCAIPGHDGEFLAAESGYEGDRFGRVFHVAVERDALGMPAARIVQVLAMPRLYDRIEGMAIGKAVNGDLTLLYGERGTNELPGKISWGRLTVDAESIVFQFRGDMTLKAPYLPSSSNPRDCTDLFIDARSRIWIAATVAGDEDGPYRSVIYRAADFDTRRHRPVELLDGPAATWIIDGFKVKAITDSPDDADSLCFISDDDELGWVWRPLSRPMNSRVP